MPRVNRLAMRPLRPHLHRLQCLLSRRRRQVRSFLALRPLLQSRARPANQVSTRQLWNVLARHANASTRKRVTEHFSRSGSARKISTGSDARLNSLSGARRMSSNALRNRSNNNQDRNRKEAYGRLAARGATSSASSCVARESAESPSSRTTRSADRSGKLRKCSGSAAANADPTPLFQ